MACLGAPLWAQAPAEAPRQPPTLQKVRETGVITLAHRESSIPFSYLDANKRPVGYALDLCMRVVDALKRDLKMPNLRVEYLAVTPAQRIPSIVEGKADLECGNTTNTAARRKQAAFAITTISRAGAARQIGRRHPAPCRRARQDHRRQCRLDPSAFLDKAQQKGLFAGRIIEAKDADAAFADLEAKRADAYCTTISSYSRCRPTARIRASRHR